MYRADSDNHVLDRLCRLCSLCMGVSTIARIALWIGSDSKTCVRMVRNFQRTSVPRSKSSCIVKDTEVPM